MVRTLHSSNKVTQLVGKDTVHSSNKVTQLVGKDTVHSSNTVTQLLGKDYINNFYCELLRKGGRVHSRVKKFIT